MTDTAPSNSADLRRALLDLEDDISRALIGLNVAINSTAPEADIADALADFGWTVGRALQTFKRELGREAGH